MIRTERAGDEVAIRAVETAAFGIDRDAQIVDDLRGSDAYIPELSLVAEDGGAVVGHVIVSRGHVEPSGEPIFLLGPIGVVPEREGEGIGSSLVDAALAGDPAYYERFGFLEAEPLELLPPAGWRSRPFQVALLDPEAELPQGRVEYSNAFRD